MTIGTSFGHAYEDAFQHQAGNPMIVGEMDTEGEKQPSGTRDENVVDPGTYIKNKALQDDPKNIYNDQGDIVDYDMPRNAPILPKDRIPPKIEPRSDSGLIQPVANITNTPDEIMSGLEGVRVWNGGTAGPTQFRKPANQNKNFQIDDPAMEEAVDLSWKSIVRGHELRSEMDNLLKLGRPLTEFENKRYEKLHNEHQNIFQPWLHENRLTDFFGLTSPAVAKPTPEIQARSLDYPTEQEADEAVARGLGSDTGNESFIRGNQGRSYRTPIKTDSLDNTINRMSYEATDKEKLETATSYAKAEIAKTRSAIATLGYDPNKVTMENTRLNIAGAYDRNTDRMLWVASEPGAEHTLIHESLHRGLAKLGKQSDEARQILKGHDEEMIVRYIMATQMGDRENQEQWPESVKQRNEAIATFKKYPHMSRELGRLEEIAAELHKERRPRGPN